MSDKLKFVKEKTIDKGVQKINRQWKILVVDDENAVHDMIIRVLKEFEFDGGGLHFLHANSGEEANYLVKKHPDISVILLDVVMETDDAGLNCIKFIRDTLNNDIVQIVLLTGQPGQAPEQAIIKNYGINDYQAKAELTSQRLNSIVTVAIRAYQLSHSLKREILERQQVEKELVEAKKIADAANQAKTNFLSTMSHELRTPMNGIIGVADILLSSINDQDNKSLVNIIHESGKALLKILNDILDLTRLEAKQLLLEEEDFEINELAKDIQRLYQPQIQLKGLNLKFQVGAKLEEEYLGDINRLHQVLSNLISNAVKFTEKGEISISIIVADKGVDQDILQFEVSDTGIGIADSAFDNIFNSFTQVDSTKSRKFNGIGAGLAITKYLVDFMGGEIGVSSQLGKGSLFWVRLPFKRLKRNL